MKLYTAQFRYNGGDRIDITSRTSHPLGKLFAPPWSLVSNYNNGRITDDEYTDEYSDILIRSIASSPAVWVRFIALEMATLVCYCKVGNFCHRIVAAHFCLTMTPTVRYIGERIPV